LAIEYATTCSPELTKRLAKEGRQDFDSFIKAKVNLTTEKMREDWEFDEQRICEKEVKQQAETYQSHLATSLKGTDIDHETTYWVNPMTDHLCQCRDSNITGASLRLDRLAVFTRCDQTGQPMGSLYHYTTPRSIDGAPFTFTPSPFAPLTDRQAEAREEYLNNYHATFHRLWVEDSRHDTGRTRDRPPERNQAIIDKIKQDPKFEHLSSFIQYTDKDPEVVPWAPFHFYGNFFCPVNLRDSPEKSLALGGTRPFVSSSPAQPTRR